MLTLTSAQIDQIKTHAEACYPQECCGLLLGIIEGLPDHPQKILYALQPTDNVWDTQTDPCRRGDDHPDLTLTTARRYRIAPQDLLQAQKYARLQGWDIIGIYHSHPDQIAVPSECDRQGAWPQYSYLIVAVEGGTAHEIQNWVLNDQHQFQLEAMILSQDATLSNLEASP
ncbi:MAG: M67 family metallopeptidase [Acaryochloridaceae cyanobacterium SU_2_1]|nr:M67 family metallopeptidase [Acaryochloridaceae cyanobacterium SU_2_1]NJM95334.1 M67 family metallopeptidase [Acaryochloridaceae cyanobacterium CSU_5_19]